MKTSFNVGDIVKVVSHGGRVVYAIIRAACGESFRIESLNSESFEAMGHQRWVKKSQVLSAN